MNIVIAVKNNRIVFNEPFSTYPEAQAYAFGLIKDQLFFDEIGVDDEPLIPAKNPFTFNDDFHQSMDGRASIEICHYMAELYQR